MTPNEIAAALAKLSRELDDVTVALDTADRDAVNAREDYTMAYAKAFLAADGSMDVRRYVATEQTHDTRLAAEAAEQIVRGLRTRRDTLKVRVDVGRSVNAALKAELATLGGQP
jgi:hypothetical protein